MNVGENQSHGAMIDVLDLATGNVVGRVPDGGATAIDEAVMRAGELHGLSAGPTCPALRP